jgi:hypothetical protein
MDAFLSAEKLINEEEIVTLIIEDEGHSYPAKFCQNFSEKEQISASEFLELQPPWIEVNPAKFLCGTPKICDEFLHAQRASK